MKEQGREFDLSKEPVKNGTIVAIVKECQKMFDIKLPLLKADIPVERDLRVGYSEDGQRVIVYKGCDIDIQEGENLARGWRKFSPRDNGESGYTIFLTEHLRKQKFIDWDRDYIYDYSEKKLERIDKSEKLSYIYLVDFYKDSYFMQLFITPKAWIEKYKSRGFSFLQVKRIEELLRQGFPVGSLDISDVMKDPISNSIVPLEEMAENLLRFMKIITSIKRYSPEPAF